MIIGIISDSHIPVAAKELWPEVRLAFAGVELILHAGDIYDTSALDWLEEIAPVLAARGNGDYLTQADSRIKDAQVLEVEGRRIGVIHYLYYPGLSIEQIMRRFFGGPVDVLVYGDSHVESIERRDGVLLVNPGSPTFPHNLQPQLGTVALLEITAEGVEARIVDLKRPL